MIPLLAFTFFNTLCLTLCLVPYLGKTAQVYGLVDRPNIHLKKTQLFTTVIPSKLFECMGMGIPVLHGVAGESADIVLSEGCGTVFEPENVDELCAGLLAFKHNPVSLERCRQRALAAAKKYDRKIQATMMLDALVAVKGRCRRRRQIKPHTGEA